jgi:uncharacterized protein (TIGR00304 family)
MSGSEVHDIFTSCEELSEVASAGLINYYKFSGQSFSRNILEELNFAKCSNVYWRWRLVELSLANIGFILIILGFVLAFIAVILLAFKSRGTSGQTRSAGILLIGPIPIIFGSDKQSARVLMVLAVLLIAIVLIFMLLPNFLLSR